MVQVWMVVDYFSLYFRFPGYGNPNIPPEDDDRSSSDEGDDDVADDATSPASPDDLHGGESVEAGWLGQTGSTMRPALYGQLLSLCMDSFFLYVWTASSSRLVVTPLIVLTPSSLSCVQSE